MAPKGLREVNQVTYEIVRNPSKEWFQRNLNLDQNLKLIILTKLTPSMFSNISLESIWNRTRIHGPLQPVDCGNARFDQKERTPDGSSWIPGIEKETSSTFQTRL